MKRCLVWYFGYYWNKCLWKVTGQVSLWLQGELRRFSGHSRIYRATYDLAKQSAKIFSDFGKHQLAAKNQKHWDVVNRNLILFSLDIRWPGFTIVKNTWMKTGIENDFLYTPARYRLSSSWNFLKNYECS